MYVLVTLRKRQNLMNNAQVAGALSNKRQWRVKIQKVPFAIALANMTESPGYDHTDVYYFPQQVQP